MAYIDFPRPMKDRPRYGTFVTVALDAVASLEGLHDAVAEQAARQFATRKYLAMVDVVLSREPGTTHFQFYPVGSGLPTRQDSQWACIPILPATRNPEERPPIPLSKKLPMDNAYLHTAECFDGVVSRIHTDNPSDIQCSDEDLRRVCLQRLEDRSRMDEAECDDDPDPNSDELTASSLAEDEEYAFEPCVKTFLRPRYYMWLEVREDDTFADPRDHQDEIAVLAAIETEWRERREAECTAREERLLHWRAGLGDYDDVHAAPLADESSPSEHSGTESVADGPHECEVEASSPADERRDGRGNLSFANLSLGEENAEYRRGKASSSYSVLLASSWETSCSGASSSSEARPVTSEPSTSPSDNALRSSEPIPDGHEHNVLPFSLNAFTDSCMSAFMSVE